MKQGIKHVALGVVIACGSIVIGGEARALDGTIAQNSSYNVTREGAEDTLRLVAYGDSIVAGFTGINEIAERSSTHVAAEYAAVLWGQNIEVRRRAQSGAVAAGIFNRIVNDTSFMQTDNTVGVHLVMCGNDYLEARSDFAGQTGQCDFSGLATALNTCLDFTEQAIQYVNENAGPNAKLKVVGNLYYPGFDSDDVLTQCTAPDTGQPLNRRDDVFLSIIAESNWETCNIAIENGWECADNFAEFMTADFDSNGDGAIDSDAVRFVPGEPLNDYIDRILAANAAGLLRDSNFKQISPSASVGYLLSDDTHTTFLGPTGKAGATGGSPGGDVAVFHATDTPFPDFQNPDWNLNGHDRMGSALATNYDLNVDAGPDATLLACEPFDNTIQFNDRVFFGPWPVMVDFGDGSSLNTEVSEMSLELAHEFTTPGLYSVNAVVTGAYETVWHDSAVVSVVPAFEAVGAVQLEFEELVRSTLMNRAWVFGSRAHLDNAFDAAQQGDAPDAQQSLGLFVQNLEQSSTPAQDVARVSAMVDQIIAALDCETAPSSNASLRAQRPFTLPTRPVVPQGRVSETRWVEFNGVKYRPDDPRLQDLQRREYLRNLMLMRADRNG